MTAKEAQELTKTNLTGPVIQDLVDEIDQKIRDAYMKGKFSIRSPFYNLKRHLHDGEFKALEAHYEGRGFRIKDHPAEDPGHPCSAPYTTLSWAE